MTCNFDGGGTPEPLHAPVTAGSTIIAHYNALNFNLTPVDKTMVANLFILPPPHFASSFVESSANPYSGGTNMAQFSCTWRGVQAAPAQASTARVQCGSRSRSMDLRPVP